MKYEYFDNMIRPDRFDLGLFRLKYWDRDKYTPFFFNSFRVASSKKALETKMASEKRKRKQEREKKNRKKSKSAPLFIRK